MSIWRSSSSLKAFLGTALGIGLGAAAVLYIRRQHSLTPPAKPNAPKPSEQPKANKSGSHRQNINEETESTQNTSNVEEKSLLTGGPRVKFSAHWLGTLDEFFSKHPELRGPYEEVCAALSDQMHEFEELGVAPIAPDGKVGGNCSAFLQRETTSRIVVSKTGKPPHAKMEVYSDFTVIERFDPDAWSCDYYARNKQVLPTSDAPMHCAILTDTRRNMNWAQFPKVVLHGHAFETEELANERGYPISTEETLFSTKEDSDALMALLKAYPYPNHNIYIRKGHGFVLLGNDMQDARQIFNKRMRPFLINSSQ